MGLRRPGDIRKVNGNLEQVSRETAQGLAQEVGIPAVTSPLAGKVVGANEHESKMLGSSMNLRSTIRARTGTDTLENAQRIQQYEKEVSAAEKAHQKKTEDFFKNLPGMAQLDEAMAKTVKAALTPKSTSDQAVLGIDWDGVQSFLNNDAAKGAALATIAKDKVNAQGVVTEKSLLTKALAGERLGNTPEEVAAAERKIQDVLGQLDISMQNIKDNFLMDPQTQLAKQIMESKPEQISLGRIANEDLTKLGFDPEYLEDMFGAPDETGKGGWKAATYADVKNRIQELQSGFADVKELQRLAADPFASATTRTEANKRLREFGFLGRRALEEKVNDLQKQIEDGDVVKIGNQEFEIEEILEDDDWGEIINDSFSDPKLMESIQKNNPELATWIKTNESALKNQYSTMSGRLAPGQKLADILIDRDTAKTIEEEFGKFDPAEKDMLAKSLGLNLDTLTISQKQTLNTKIVEERIKTAKTETDAKYAALTSVQDITQDPALIKEVYGVDDITTLTSAQINEKLGKLEDTRNTKEFAKSGYSTDLSALTGIYQQLGLPVPKEFNITSAADWASTKPDIKAAIKQAQEQLRVKQIKDGNANLRAGFTTSGLSTAAISALYPDWQNDSVPLNPPESIKWYQDMLGKVPAGWNADKYKTSLTAFMNYYATKQDYRGMSRDPQASWKDYNVNQKWMNDPAGAAANEDLRTKTLNEVVGTNDANFTFANAMRLLGTPFDYQAIAGTNFLRVVDFKGTKRSDLPALLDSNRDGLVDKEDDIKSRILSAIKTGSDVNSLLGNWKTTGEQVQTAIKSKKDVADRVAASQALVVKTKQYKDTEVAPKINELMKSNLGILAETSKDYAALMKRFAVWDNMSDASRKEFDTQLTALYNKYKEVSQRQARDKTPKTQLEVPKPTPKVLPKAAVAKPIPRGERN